MQNAENDIDQLFAQLGAAVVSSSQSAAMNSSNWNFIEIGKTYWDDNIQKIRKAVCDDWKGCEKRAQLKEGDAEDKLLESLTDILAAYLTGIPVILVAKLVFGKGIDTLCDCKETEAASAT